MSIRALLVDDHTILREGLRGLLESKMNIKVVAEASDGRSAIELTRKFRPQIVIMDIGMPDMNGFEATRLIKEEFPQVKVIALSMHTDKQYIAKMIRAGGSAYLRKDCASEEIQKAMDAVLSGRVYLSAGVTGTSSGVVVEPAAISKYLIESLLSPRQRQVLQLLAEGKTSKFIAEEVGMSAKTVEKHRLHISEKLDLHSVAELTKYAIREGITSLE